MPLARQPNWVMFMFWWPAKPLVQWRKPARISGVSKVLLARARRCPRLAEELAPWWCSWLPILKHRRYGHGFRQKPVPRVAALLDVQQIYNTPKWCVKNLCTPDLCRQRV